MDGKKLITFKKEENSTLKIIRCVDSEAIGKGSAEWIFKFKKFKPSELELLLVPLPTETIEKLKNQSEERKKFLSGLPAEGFEFMN